MLATLGRIMGTLTSWMLLVVSVGGLAVLIAALF
jgi:hypothetical protein